MLKLQHVTSDLNNFSHLFVCCGAYTVESVVLY